MKPRKPVLILALTLIAILPMPVRLAAQDNQGHHDPHDHYKLIDLGTLGGPQSYVNIPNNYAPVLNERGTVAGWADTSAADPYPNFCFNEDCFVSHAFQSRNGVPADLGVLRGGSSSLANWMSANDLIAGISENGETDPLFSGFPEFRAVLWKNGQITDLGTLPEGGYESLANAVNSRGQVVGLATNTIPDSFSLFGTTQARAFLWQHGAMRDLGTLGGSDSVALLVNERGQVVGESYLSDTPSPYCAQNLDLPLATGAFLWERGRMKNLGSFGGTCTFATDLNNRGEVVGISTLPRDKFQHAFLWKDDSLHELHNALGGHNGAAIQINERGDVVGWASLPGDQAIHASLWRNNIMTDLGVLDGDACSIGAAANARGQVVGVSVPCDFSESRAFLWEGDSIVDLNTLILSDSSLYLTAPETINDRGEIAGVGLDSNGDQHAFLLIPCGQDDTACQDAAMGTSAARVSPVPVMQRPATTDQGNPVRRLLRQRLGFGRFRKSAQQGALNGKAAVSGPNVSLSPASLSFSTQAIGTTSAVKTVTLKNTGTASLTISGIAITGTNAGNFAQTHTCGSLLAAGASCSISVTFKPTASGTRTAAVSISDSAAGSPQKVLLSGTGTTAKLSPASLSFGSVVIGNTSPAEGATLTNVGTTALNITNIAITGTNASDFAQTHTCGTLLAAGASCSISVTFKPTASGTRTAAVSISDNALGSRQKLSLSGAGMAGRCSPQGMECPPQFPPCCPGLVCQLRGNRAFCEPGASENTSRTDSYWDQLDANKLD